MRLAHCRSCDVGHYYWESDYRTSHRNEGSLYATSAMYVRGKTYTYTFSEKDSIAGQCSEAIA